MFFSSKSVPGIGKSFVRLNDQASRSNVQHLPRRLERRGIYTRTSHQSAHWKTAINRNRRLFVAGGLTSSISVLAISTALNKPGPQHNLTDISEPNVKDPTSSILQLDEVPSHAYHTSDENLRAAFEEFKDLLGVDNVSLQNGERITHSSTEWSPAPHGDQDKPSMIVYPRSTQDVSDIAKVCHRRRIPMIAFGGGTSLESTLAAENQEVCLDFNRHMNKVLKIRKDDMDVTLQPSVSYEQLNEILAKDGMFFPPDPGPGAQIGGMIAQGCSGTNAFRYGTMKDWVLGLTVVLADGTIIKTRHRPRKSSSGYDLTRLFVGSEGTLGFVTEANLKLTRAPQNLRVAVTQFPTVHDAVRFAVKVIQGGYQPEAMELLDAVTMRAMNAAGYYEKELPEKPTIFLKLAGQTVEDVQRQAQVASKLAEAAQSLSFTLAKDEEESETLWTARKTALWSALALKNNPDDEFLAADACVPVSRLGDIIERTHAMLKESGLFGCTMGHVGDGNFHAMVTFSREEKTKARKLISDIQRQSVDLDGTVTGEHGIGIEFRDQVVYELGASSVDAMRRVKYALDPLLLLNPGKMIRLVAEESSS